MQWGGFQLHNAHSDFVEIGLLVYKLKLEVFRHVPKERVASSGYFHSIKSERRPKASV
jgi:hypothetical protein